MVELDEVVDASLFSSDLVGLEDACNKRKFKQQNKNGETCSFCEHCGDKFKNKKDITCFFCEHCGNLCDFCKYSRTRCKYDGKEKIKIRFDEKIWEGFTNKHYLRPLNLAEEKNDDLIHDSLDTFNYEVEEEHHDTINVNVRSTLDQDRLILLTNFNKIELNHKGANDCYVLGKKKH